LLAVDAEYKKERCQLEKKYFALKNEIWSKRPGIVTGTTEVESRVAVEEGDGMHDYSFHSIIGD
jgi:hypothetical protein